MERYSKKVTDGWRSLVNDHSDYHNTWTGILSSKIYVKLSLLSKKQWIFRVFPLFFCRSSWPPRPVSSKLIYGSRPLSPPVTFPPAKVPRAVPGGFVSKIALPSYQDSDSGYSEWSRSISQRENFLKSQRSSSGFAGDFHYYYWKKCDPLHSNEKQRQNFSLSHKTKYNAT